MAELVKTRMEPVHVFNMEELLVGDLVVIRKLESRTFDGQGNVDREHYDIDGVAYIKDIWEDELHANYINLGMTFVLTPEDVVDSLWTIEKVGANNG